MSVRGAWGLRYKGQDKIKFNYWDSYPDRLGKDILEFLVKHKDNLGELETFFKKIELLTKGSEKAKKYYKKFGDNTTQDIKDLYVKEYPQMVDDKDFLQDSLYCEYGYIINLDTRKLELYIGFQKDKPPENRYSIKKRRNEYWNCKLVGELEFNNVFFPDIEISLLSFFKEKDRRG